MPNTSDDVEKLLKPEQITRVRQIILQDAGANALADPEVAEDLSYNEGSTGTNLPDFTPMYVNKSSRYLPPMEKQTGTPTRFCSS